MTTDDEMIVHCVWEHNKNDSLIYSSNVIGAFTRGASKEEALVKMEREIESYFLWTGEIPPSSIEMIITQESVTNLSISDADSEVLFMTSFQVAALHRKQPGIWIRQWSPSSGLSEETPVKNTCIT